MRNIVLRIVRCIVDALLSIALVALFAGLFYDANKHVVMINILYWVFVLMTAYFITFSVFLLINHLFKAEKPRLVDGFAFSSGIAAIIIFSLFLIKDVNDSLFINVFVLIGSVIAVFQLIYEIFKRANKKAKNSEQDNK